MFFRNANAGAPPGAAYQSPLGLSAAPQLSSLVGAQPNVEKLVEDHLAVQSLIRAYQVHTLPKYVDRKYEVAMVMFCFYSFPFDTCFKMDRLLLWRYIFLSFQLQLNRKRKVGCPQLQLDSCNTFKTVCEQKNKEPQEMKEKMCAGAGSDLTGTAGDSSPIGTDVKHQSALLSRRQHCQ